jgi:hypothetical protein
MHTHDRFHRPPPKGVERLRWFLIIASLMAIASAAGVMTGGLLH